MHLFVCESVLNESIYVSNIFQTDLMSDSLQWLAAVPTSVIYRHLTLPAAPSQKVSEFTSDVQQQAIRPRRAITWSPADDLGHDLVIQSADRTRHTGTYNCSVDVRAE